MTIDELIKILQTLKEYDKEEEANEIYVMVDKDHSSPLNHVIQNSEGTVFLLHK